MDGTNQEEVNAKKPIPPTLWVKKSEDPTPPPLQPQEHRSFKYHACMFMHYVAEIGDFVKIISQLCRNHVLELFQQYVRRVVVMHP